MTARAQRVIDDCRIIAGFSEDPLAITRTFLSQSTHDVHRFLRQRMEAAGMEVNIDAAGNLRGLYRGRPGERRLLLGSHIDTVPNAGAFDGVLGVVLAIALIAELQAHPGGGELGIAVEVIAFSEEEGVRFGAPFLGSRAVAGDLMSDLLQRKDVAGITVEDAIRGFGLDPDELPSAVADATAVGYVEFHIEQGPVLDSIGIGLGIVEAIAGQTRLEVIFGGRANHAGTTPMHLRHDALAGAAEWMIAVERYARATPGLVATIGQIAASPGAANVIPGEVRLSLDVRHTGDDAREAAVATLLDEAQTVVRRRGLTLEYSVRVTQPAVAMNKVLAVQLEAAAAATGHSTHRMVSGAGHDATVLAAKMPVAMLFLRSPSGISHHPDELALVDDVEAAMATGLYFLEHLNLE